MAARRVDALLLTDSKALLCGILTNKDIADRVVTQQLNLEDTPVSKVMTKNPVFVLSDTLAVEALQKMMQGKFGHLPVVENGEVIALLDIAKCIYDAIARMERAADKGKAIAAAVEGVEKHWGTTNSGPNTYIETLRERMFRPSLSTIIPENSKHVGNTAAISNEATNNMMQKFWDSAMALSPSEDEEDTLSEGSLRLASDGTETGRSLPSHLTKMANAFSFKVQDKKGRMHRFTCETRSLADLLAAILQRMGDEIDCNNLPQILYEDEDRDKVLLASDNDLATAIDHARSAGWKVLRLHLDYSGAGRRSSTSGGSLEYANADAWASAYRGVAAGAALVAGLGVLAYLKRAGT